MSDAELREALAAAMLEAALARNSDALAKLKTLAADTNNPCLEHREWVDVNLKLDAARGLGYSENLSQHIV